MKVRTNGFDTIRSRVNHVFSVTAYSGPVNPWDPRQELHMCEAIHSLSRSSYTVNTDPPVQSCV